MRPEDAYNDVVSPVLDIAKSAPIPGIDIFIDLIKKPGWPL